MLTMALVLVNQRKHTGPVLRRFTTGVISLPSYSGESQSDTEKIFSFGEACCCGVLMGSDASWNSRGETTYSGVNGDDFDILVGAQTRRRVRMGKDER